MCDWLVLLSKIIALMLTIDKMNSAGVVPAARCIAIVASFATEVAEDIVVGKIALPLSSFLSLCYCFFVALAFPTVAPVDLLRLAVVAVLLVVLLVVVLAFFPFPLLLFHSSCCYCCGCGCCCCWVFLCPFLYSCLLLFLS